VGDFSQYLQYEVGDGTKVKFWCGDCPLKEAYPKLFCITRVREASVTDLMKFCNEALHWDLRFSRSVKDCKLESLSAFMD
jgi:hypothetical protein